MPVNSSSISSTGFVGHINKTIMKRNGILTQLRGFSSLTPKMKSIQVKTSLLLIAVMDDPSIPSVCMASVFQTRIAQTAL